MRRDDLVRWFGVLLGASLWLVSAPPTLAADALCSTDVDGNGQTDQSTDGLLVLRHLFGFSGDALTQGAIGAGATRTTSEAIRAYLAQPDCQAMLDVDGNGQLDALTDGVLFSRYCVGFRSESLILSALGDGSRIDADSIATNLAYYSGPRSEVAGGGIDPGQHIVLPNGLGELENVGAEVVDFSVVQGKNESGSPVIEIGTSGPLTLTLPDPNSLPAQSAEMPMSQQETVISSASFAPYVVTKYWGGEYGWFSALDQLANAFSTYNRLPTGREGVTTTFWNRIFIMKDETYILKSVCESDDIACYSDSKKPPVLFIHGYLVGDSMGGGEDTWADFPRLVMEDGFVPFEFRWNTSARFQDVALDLARVIEQIAQETGQRVHLVAHSFGGLLVRTLLQGVNLNGQYDDIADHIASVATLGTPHSGIADSPKCMHDIAFPGGQDSLLFEGCGQLSCYMAGEYVALDADRYGIADRPGELIAALSDVVHNPLPDVDIMVLIGLTTRRNPNIAIEPIPGTIVDTGDALITYAGQRFLPTDSVYEANSPSSCSAESVPSRVPLRSDAAIGSAHVTEHVLGFDDDTLPGKINEASGSGGYRHSASIAMYAGLFPPPAEPHVVCESGDTCSHDGWKYVRDWLHQHSSISPPLPPTSSPLNDTGITACSNATTQTGLTCPVAGYPEQDAQFGRDATHNDDSDGHAGFSFTKLDASGNPLAASAANWTCVRDNVTGLIWEVKTDDGGLRDKDWTYSWYNPDAGTNGGNSGTQNNGSCSGSLCDTQGFVEAVNAQGLCGAHDWRMPSRLELMSIVSNERNAPAIDAGYFPNTQSDWFWSSSPYTGQTGNAWNVYFYNGSDNYNGKAYGEYVRLVRGGQ